MTQPWLRWAILGTLLLAGCAGTPTEDGPPADSLAVDGATLDAAPVTLRFEGLDEPLHRQLWANDTVPVQNTCNTGGCIGGIEGVLHVTDLTPELPRGVPTAVELELTYEPNPLGFGGFDVWLQAPESTTYQSRTEVEPGHVVVRATLRPVGAVEAVVFAGGPGGQAPETPYTLRIRVDADPELVAPGVPVAVELGPGSSLAVASGGGGRPRFLLYAPDDSLLGTFTGEHVLPATAAAGEYVALLPAGEASANLTVDSGAASLRAIGLRFEFGTEGTLPPNGAYDAPWDVAGFPLGVGLWAHNVPSAAGPSPLISAGGLTLGLAGPNGFALDSGDVCGVCLSFGEWGLGLSSDIGDERVVAGTYTVHAESNAVYDLRVAPFAQFLDRTSV